ncbi:MAG: metalloregulator ArsR/SmtB family transcription factor [Alphaproteobacteria bacterium]|nr:metalloregulator ArsR/SmtB family transcription factor [Alphaproteobacteria bacterium]
MKTESAIAAFAALAQETRLAAFRALIEAGPAGLAAGDVAARCGASAPVMSFHLKELVRADLVKSRRDGRQVIYAADYVGVRALIDFIMRDCCKADPTCCGPYTEIAAQRRAKATRREIAG